MQLYSLMLQFMAPISSVILMMFGSAFYTTFVSLYLKTMGYSNGDIGLVQSAHFLGLLIGGFRMERLIKRVGHIQALTVFGSVATCSILVQALIQDLPAWIILRFLNGLSLAALYIVIESWMLKQSNIKNRGLVLSLYMISLLAAQSASQQMFWAVEIQTLTPFLLAAIFTSLGIIPVGLSRKRIEIPEAQEPINFFKIFKKSPFGVSGCLIAGIIISSIYSFFPIFSLNIGIPIENLMSVTIAGGVFLQWPIGIISDYFDRRSTILGTIAITLALTLASFVYQGQDWIVIYPLLFFVGGFLYSLYPLSVAQVCDHVDQEQIIAATGLLLVAFGIGSVMGPVICSLVIEIFGIHYIFLYFFVLLAVFEFIGLFSFFSRPIVPLDEQTDFLPMPSVTPVAYEMDPRGED